MQPVHFDPQQTIAFSTMIPLSFAYSRLVKVKGGSAVVPGTQPIEGDLAESWERQGDNVYVFKLKKGVRWHNKPPVNGRELTAEDVRYTYDRFLNIKGNANRYILEMVDKVEAVDKYTVKFTLQEPNAWFIDRLASTSTWIIAKECVDQYGDLKKPESVVGTGPWMFQNYEPNVRMSFVRNPNYFVPGLPYVDGVDVTIDSDPAAAFAPFLSGKYDFGPEYGMVIRRSDLAIATARVKGLGMRDYIVVFGGFTAMKLDQDPFKDVRVRRAIAMADNWRETLETNAWSQGKGVPNPLIPAALKDWSIPIDQLPAEGRKLYEFDPAGGQAAHRRGRPSQRSQGPGRDDARATGRTGWTRCRSPLTNWKQGGHRDRSQAQGVRRVHLELDLRQVRQEHVDPARRHHRPRHLLHPVPARRAAQLLRRERSEADRHDQAPAPHLRRQEAARDSSSTSSAHAAQHVYYAYGASVSAVGAWMPYVKNFGPNIGHDYGGRLMVAWLDK